MRPQQRWQQMLPGPSADPRTLLVSSSCRYRRTLTTVRRLRRMASGSPCTPAISLPLRFVWLPYGNVLLNMILGPGLAPGRGSNADAARSITPRARSRNSLYRWYHTHGTHFLSLHGYLLIPAPELDPDPTSDPRRSTTCDPGGRTPSG